jgi:ABC-type multidrug transport system fused ATPase/permease subunit
MRNNENKKIFSFWINILGKKYIAKIIFVSFLFLLFSSANNFLPLIYGRLLEASLGGTVLYSWWVFWVVISLVIISAQQILTRINSFQKIHVLEKLIKRHFNKIISTLDSSIEVKGSAYFTAALIKTAEGAANIFSLESIAGIINLVSLAIIAGILFSIDITVGFLTLGLCFVAVLLHKRGNAYYIKNDTIHQKDKMALLNDTADTLNGHKVIESLNAYPYEKNRSQKTVKKHMNFYVKFRSVSFLIFFFFLELFRHTYLVIVMSRVFYMAFNDRLSIATAIVAIFYSTMVSAPIQYLNYLLDQLRSGWASSKVLIDTFHSDSGKIETATTVAQSIEKADLKIDRIKTIRFDSVSLSHGDKKVLNNFSFYAEAGKRYSFAAPSGSGKTTMIKLLIKFFTDYQGDIYINDKNIKLFDAAFLCEHIALLMQDSDLLDISVSENIALSQETPDENLIKELLENMGLNYYDFKDKKPSELSGGEKDRVLLARALYRVKNKSIIILDEPLVGVDKANQLKTFKYLEKIFHDKIVLLISHDEYSRELFYA